MIRENIISRKMINMSISSLERARNSSDPVHMGSVIDKSEAKYLNEWLDSVDSWNVTPDEYGITIHDFPDDEDIGTHASDIHSILGYNVDTVDNEHGIHIRLHPEKRDVFMKVLNPKPKVNADTISEMMPFLSTKGVAQR